MSIAHQLNIQNPFLISSLVWLTLDFLVSCFFKSREILFLPHEARRGAAAAAGDVGGRGRATAPGYGRRAPEHGGVCIDGGDGGRAMDFLAFSRESSGDSKSGFSGDLREISGDFRDLSSDLRENSADLREISGDLSELSGDLREFSGDSKDFLGV